MNFHELGLNKAILRTLGEIGLVEPTPIQTQAIPIVLEGHDVVGLAQTGTGKTAAFLLPLLQRLNNPDHKGKFRPVRVLVLSPTRELAAQIYEKAREYGKSLNLRSQVAVGGVPINRQINTLKRGTDILIATPGRLLDLAKRNAIKLDHIEAIVLDEADHMLDIGFLPDIKRIIAQLPKERQTLLFSATMPKQIQDLAAQYLNDPVHVSVARQSSVAEKIEQLVKHVPVRQKHNELVSLVKANENKRIVVFSRTKHGSDKIVKRLEVAEIQAAAIHGNKSQGQRERALKAFSSGKCMVLIATDIAARGIDIKDISLVVNYDLPEVPEVYVHRIGRTARAGSSGLAVSFCADHEFNLLRSIERLIKQTIPAEGEPLAPEGGATKKPQRKRPRNRPGANARRKDQARKQGSEKPSKRRGAPETESRDKSEKAANPKFKKQKPKQKTANRPKRNRNKKPAA